MEFRTSFNSGAVVKFLNGTAKKLKDLSPLMKTARVVLKKSVDDNFETQGESLGKKWKPWSEGWKKYRLKKKHGSGKILNFSGELRRDIRAKSGRDFALVGVNKEYAAIHNFGGASHLKRNKNMPKRKFMALSEYQKDNLLAELYLKTEEMLMENGARALVQKGLK